MFLTVLAGRRIAPGASPGRKVRTPLGATLRNSGFAGDTRRQSVSRRTDGQCHRKQTASAQAGVMVKRCGKSAPREAQATRHGKPRRVQGQIGNRGAARSAFRESETGFGYRSLRQMILSARKSADRIRLTALPKPTQTKCRMRKPSRDCGNGFFISASTPPLRSHFLRGSRHGRQWRRDWRCRGKHPCGSQGRFA